MPAKPERLLNQRHQYPAAAIQFKPSAASSLPAGKQSRLLAYPRGAEFLQLPLIVTLMAANLF